MKLQLLALFVLVAIVYARNGNHLKKKCRYSRGFWGKCDALTNLVTMEMTLKPDSPDTCAATHVKTKTCHLKKRQEKILDSIKYFEEKRRLKNHKKMIKQKNEIGCKYEIVSKCDPKTNLVTKTFTLLSGDVTDCAMESVSYSQCHLRKKQTSSKAKRQKKKDPRNITEKKKKGTNKKKRKIMKKMKVNKMQRIF